MLLAYGKPHFKRSFQSTTPTVEISSNTLVLKKSSWLERSFKQEDRNNIPCKDLGAGGWTDKDKSSFISSNN